MGEADEWDGAGGAEAEGGVWEYGSCECGGLCYGGTGAVGEGEWIERKVKARAWLSVDGDVSSRIGVLGKWCWMLVVAGNPVD